MTSIASVVQAAAARLCDAGWSRDEARRDALVLARGVLKWTLADWLARSTTETPDGFASTFADLVDRRRQHEPVAYLLGEKEFYGRSFMVTADTLIPRPETEGLVDAALTWLGRTDRPAPSHGTHRVVDVGTGTGCVAISIALEYQGASPLAITATDIAPRTLEVARKNAAQLGATSVDFRLGHLLADAATPIDLIVSNPPYVPARDRHTLQEDVVRFEPAHALFGGDSGLDVVAQLIPAARAALASGGALMMEIGVGQAADVTALLHASGFVDIKRHLDLQGIERILVAHTPAASL